MIAVIINILLLLFSNSIITASSEVTNYLRAGSKPNQRELRAGTRIFLKYNNFRGRQAARKCARSIIQDSDDDDIMIIQGNGMCIDQLTRNPDIAEIDFDEEVSALSFDDYYYFSTKYLLSALSNQKNESYNGKDSVEVLHDRALGETYSWGLDMIQADRVTPGDYDITVCVVDSGIAIGHPDLNVNRIDGTDRHMFTGDTLLWNHDLDGHGTHVAGVIAAIKGNDMGVAGAGNFRLHITRALDNNGRGYESDIRKAVEQCVEAGAKIINLSLGGTFMSRLSTRYYREIVEDMGIMLVAAAGNDGTTEYIYPASHPSVISVGAVYEWGTRWEYSNRNNQVELAGPGHEILSTSTCTNLVRTPDGDFAAIRIPGSSLAEESDGTVTGELIYCEASEDKCKKAKNGKICLFAKDNTDILSMVESCILGGGVGAIIFSADGSNMNDWSLRRSGTISMIPVVAVEPTYSENLMTAMGQDVTIGDAGNDGIEYTYVKKSGTSMASPHVAAAAALLWSNFGDCTNHQIRYAMARTAENPEGDGACDENYGYGVVKVKDAYDWLSSNPCSEWDVDEISIGGCTTIQ